LGQLAYCPGQVLNTWWVVVWVLLLNYCSIV
jgi:hypothetical protein